MLGLRTLTYKIKNSKGYYYMINSDSESKIYSDFDKIKQDDDFLRILNIKIKK